MSRIHEALRKADLDRKLLRAGRNVRAFGDLPTNGVTSRAAVVDHEQMSDEDRAAQAVGSPSNESNTSSDDNDLYASKPDYSEIGSRTEAVRQTTVFHKFLHRFLSKHNSDLSRGLALAITSISSHEDSAFVAKGLANALHHMSIQRILRVSEDSILHAIHPSTITADAVVSTSVGESETQTSQDFEDYADDTSARWGNSLNSHRHAIWELCAENDMVLIDCPPLNQTNGALPVASLVDGIVLVIQAGSTTKREVISAERAILEAGGSFEGFILIEAPQSMPLWLSNIFGLR